MGLDKLILETLPPSGLTFDEIKKSLGRNEVNDGTLYRSLNRLCKYNNIRKVIYYNFFRRAKYYYIPFNSHHFKVKRENKNDQHICVILRRDVILDDGTPCYFYSYLNCLGEEVDHYLEPVDKED